MTDPIPRLIVCERCGRTGRAEPPMLPEGWEGAESDTPGYGPVCPDCQFTEWHPHCTSLVDVREGTRVDPEVDWAGMPREERDYKSLTRCEYIDLSISLLADESGVIEQGPKDWTCSNCGGHQFELVHRDYFPSGLQPGTFSATATDEGGNPLPGTEAEGEGEHDC